MFPLRDNVPSRRFPFINLSLIAVNIIFFIHELRLAERGLLEPFLNAQGLVPVRFLADPFMQWQTVFMAMFLHGSWAHLLGNIWFLHVFGDNVEDNLGHTRYLIYYLLMGVGAAAVQMAANPTSKLPMIGASGAIAGILGSYFVLHPRARVETLFIFIILVRVIELPAFFFLGYWFLIQAANGAGAITAVAKHGDVGGVAWWAHAGGFLVGFITIWFFRRRRYR